MTPPTAASLAIASGANVKAVQEMLGHASASMTRDRDGHLVGDELDALRSGLSRRRALLVCPQCVPKRPSLRLLTVILAPDLR